MINNENGLFSCADDFLNRCNKHNQLLPRRILEPNNEYVLAMRHKLPNMPIIKKMHFMLRPNV